MSSIQNLIRWLFFLLDTVVYWAIDQAYYIFSLLTEVSIFTQDQIKAFSSRIYVLISIIMLFRLGFSFITYILNPDTITDKQKGGTKILKDVIVAIVLLVSVPTIFNEAMHVQQIIFKNDVISKILLDNKSEASSSYEQDGQIKDVESSNMLSTYAFLSFFRPNPEISGCSSFEGISISDTCVNALNSISDVGSNPGNAYKKALETYNIDFVLNSQIVVATGKGVSLGNNDFYMGDDSLYLFEYHYLLSTIFGAVVASMLIGFCLDLAVRVVKLGFLQIIAPIPIILSISPSNKNNTLTNWGKECFSTWVSLFVRMLVISFALNIILLINSGGGVFSMVTGGKTNQPIVTVFVMLGVLLFAKEFPKLLEDLLGIKGAGKITFNPLKRLTEVPGIGGGISKAAAFAGAGAHLAGNMLKNGLLRGGEKIFADRKLSEDERALRRQERFNERLNASFAEFEGRRHADPTKKYTGDTQSSLMHKKNMEQRKAYREQKQQDKLEGNMLVNGRDAKAKLDVANDTLDKIAKGQEIDNNERDAIINAFKNAYGPGHDIYAKNAADLEIAKKKQDYLKTTVSELERLANANPTDMVVAEKLREANKQLDGTNKQVSGLEEKSKVIEKVDTGAANITKGIKLAKAESSAEKVDYKKINANEISSMVNDVVASNKEASKAANEQLQSAIVGAINQGFMNMNGSSNSGDRNWQIDGVPVSAGDNGNWIDRNGNTVNGTPNTPQQQRFQSTSSTGSTSQGSGRTSSTPAGSYAANLGQPSPSGSTGQGGTPQGARRTTSGNAGRDV